MSGRPTEVLLRAERYLDRHGVDAPRATAEILLADLLRTDRVGLYTRAERLTPDQARDFGRALCRRCEGVPLQHLTGEQAFRGIVVAVRPGVFVPRPETEVVVETALAAIADVAEPLVVDVCTGTGVIALAIASERPDARVLAVDRSPAAAALARENAERLGLEVEVLEGDLLAPLPDDLRGTVDLVVSNPPYVRPDEVDALPADVLADPMEALVGDLALTERLARGAREALRQGGTFIVEIGEAQADEVRGVLAGFRDVRVERDLVGRDRVVVAS
ncbi:MAG: peptide chain release factor N(5)-glutamine methyltransferase [Actinomycetota bacterium]